MTPPTEQLADALRVMNARCDAATTCATALAVHGHHTGMCLKADAHAKQLADAYVAKWGWTRTPEGTVTAPETAVDGSEAIEGRTGREATTDGAPNEQDHT